MQDAYESHRVKRNAQQKAAIMADDFPGWKIDDILMRLDGPRKEDGYVDPRHCLVIWARPPSPICELVAWLQNELKTVAPCKCNGDIFCSLPMLRLQLRSPPN